MRGPSHRREQGARDGVVVQSDLLPLSTLLVAPTSTSARPASFRSEIIVAGRSTRVLAEQTAAVGPGRLGDRAGQLTGAELLAVDAALRVVLGVWSRIACTRPARHEWPLRAIRMSTVDSRGLST